LNRNIFCGGRLLCSCLLQGQGWSWTILQV
jgi:hypothetical protein